MHELCPLCCWYLQTAFLVLQLCLLPVAILEREVFCTALVDTLPSAGISFCLNRLCDWIMGEVGRNKKNILKRKKVIKETLFIFFFCLKLYFINIKSQLNIINVMVILIDGLFRKCTKDSFKRHALQFINYFQKMHCVSFCSLTWIFKIL